MRPLIILILWIMPLYAFNQNEKAEWNFPVKPGTEEWKNLTTYEEKLNAYNIPEEILGKMSTAELVKTCLNYPELRLIMTRNSLQQGYDYLKSIFNGFSELENRSDAGKELLKEYKKLSPANIKNFTTPVDRGRYAFQFTYIEILLAQQPIIAHLDKTDKKELLRACISNYEMVREMPKSYGTFGLTSPAMVLGRILKVDKYPDFISKESTDNKLKNFVNKSYYEGVSTLSDIVSYSKGYLKQLENE